MQRGGSCGVLCCVHPVLTDSLSARHEPSLGLAVRRMVPLPACLLPMNESKASPVLAGREKRSLRGGAPADGALGAARKVSFGRPRFLSHSFKLALLIAAAVSTGCTSGDLVSQCSAQTCSGCCTANGQCVTTETISACGVNGASCSTCTSIQECDNGQCVPIDTFDAGQPTVDAGCPGCVVDAGPVLGSGFTLSVDNFDGWCTVTVNAVAQVPLVETYTFDAGTVVSLDATANVNFVWAYWTGTDGADAGNGGHDPSMETAVTMDSNKSVLACCDNVGAGLTCPD
jgi:hypothetical protein